MFQLDQSALVEHLFNDLVSNAKECCGILSNLNFVLQIPQSLSTEEINSLALIEIQLDDLDKESLTDNLSSLISLIQILTRMNQEEREEVKEMSIESFAEELQLNLNILDRLKNKKMLFLHHFCNCLISRIEQRSYLYINIPKAIKIPIQKDLIEQFDKSIENYQSKETLLSEIKEVITSCSDSHQSILDHDQVETSLSYFLEEIVYCEAELLSHIPKEILCKHIVHFEKHLSFISNSLVSPESVEQKVFVEIEEEEEMVEDIDSIFTPFNKKLSKHSFGLRNSHGNTSQLNKPSFVPQKLEMFKKTNNKEFFLYCNFTEEEIKDAEEKLGEFEIEINNSFSFVDLKDFLDEFSKKVQKFFSLAIKYEEEKKSGVKIRILLEMKGLSFEKESKIFEGYKNWEDLLSKRCLIENQEKINKYLKMIEEEDIYLCHWYYLSQDDLKGFEESDLQKLLYFKEEKKEIKQVEVEIKKTEGFKMREELKLEQVQTEIPKGANDKVFTCWKDFFEEVNVKDPLALSEKMIELDFFLCHWKHLRDLTFLKKYFEKKYYLDLGKVKNYVVSNSN